jgi:uncharacterized LabA/DUF88 family protein
MCRAFLKPDQTLVGVRYFTAPVRSNETGLQRQQAFWNALRATTSVEIILGRFQKKEPRCFTCGATWISYEEKETDVSIAVSIVEDAALGNFDTALIVSADSDLCPAVRSAQRLRSSAHVVAAFPPKRHSDQLRKAVDGAFTISEGVLKRSLLPDLVTTSTGHRIERPSTWV